MSEVPTTAPRAPAAPWAQLSGWLFSPVPLGRVAALRTAAYLFVAFDLLVYTGWVRNRGTAAAGLYQPLFIERVLHIPAPTTLRVQVVFWVGLALALAASTGRAPRLLGWSVLAFYFDWLLIGMSYGKVDHDRFAFLVALAVLPTVGRARHGDPRPTERAGWAVRATQLAVVATYFFASWAKLRFGGLDWLTGSTLARAIIRRGTDFADLLASVPHLLIGAQIGIVAFELLSPLVFLTRGWARYAVVGFFYSFHLLTFAMISISFAPHLVAMASFLPIERVRPIHWLRRRSRSGPSGAGDAGQYSDAGPFSAGPSGADPGDADPSGADPSGADPPSPPVQTEARAVGP